MCLPPHQVQLRERCFSSSQDGITHNCHLYLLFPPPNLGPESHILVSHSILFSAGVILCPTSLSGLACSATPFLNQAEFLHSELPYIPLYGIHGPKTVPTGVWKLTDPQKNYFTLKCLLAASLVDNTFNQKGKGEGREKEGIRSQNEARYANFCDDLRMKPDRPMVLPLPAHRTTEAQGADPLAGAVHISIIIP